MELKTILPRLEAWDAETAPDGWAIDVGDLNKWAKERLRDCSDFDSEGTAQYLKTELEKLIEYTKVDLRRGSAPAFSTE